ncbi:beta-1,3-galactosyltransferase 1-like [Amblyomma americanum]
MRWHVRQRDIIPHVVGARPFLMLPPAACPRYLAIVVCSALSHFEARATVRDTWGRDAAAKNVSVLFIVGKPEDKPSGRAIGESLKNESARYRDVIQADFRDSYRNLTLKTVLLLKWAYVHCSRTRFIFKADDDVFVNVENLLNFLKTYGESPERPFLAGYVMQGKHAVRSAGSKWYLPHSVYAPDWLPMYILGPGYVMSHGAVRPLFREALLTPFLFIEDVFLTGIVAHKVGIELTNSQCFVPHALLWSCEYRSVISAHLVSVAQLRNVWRHTHNASIQCPPLVKYNGCREVRDEKRGSLLLRALLT